MKKVKVKWIGEDRILPPHGTVSEGRILQLPKDMADSLGEQGLVEEVSKTKSKRKEEEK